MPSCKKKIQASQDQIFNYLSDLQNIVELYKDKASIKTLKDLGSACYGKQYRYQVGSLTRPEKNQQTFIVEITKYEPFESIAWSLDFEIEKQVNKNVTQVPTTILLNCSLRPKGNYTHVKLDVDFAMKEAWWVKFIFYMVILVAQTRFCRVLKDIKQDIEHKHPSLSQL